MLRACGLPFSLFDMECYWPAHSCRLQLRAGSGHCLCLSRPRSCLPGVRKTFLRRKDAIQRSNGLPLSLVSSWSRSSFSMMGCWTRCGISFSPPVLFSVFLVVFFFSCPVSSSSALLSNNLNRIKEEVSLSRGEEDERY